MQIFIGEIKPFNKVYLDKIKAKYVKQYIKEFTTFDAFLKWAGAVHRPLLLDCNFLAIINDTNTYLRDVQKMIRNIETLDNSKPFLDVVWIAGKNVRLQNITLSCDVINLKKSHKNDFKQAILKDLPYLTEEGMKELLKKIGYSWDNYAIYQDNLIEAQVSLPKDITKIIKRETIKSAPETLSNLILRRRFCLNGYLKLKSKYSERWVHQYFTEQLDKIIEFKIKLAKKEIGLAQIKNSQEMSHYFHVILYTPITDVFLLRYSLQNSIGVQMYVNYDLSTLVSMDKDDFECLADKSKQVLFK